MSHSVLYYLATVLGTVLYSALWCTMYHCIAVQCWLSTILLLYCSLCIEIQNIQCSVHTYLCYINRLYSCNKCILVLLNTVPYFCTFVLLYQYHYIIYEYNTIFDKKIVTELSVYVMRSWVVVECTCSFVHAYLNWYQVLYKVVLYT